MKAATVLTVLVSGSLVVVLLTFRTAPLPEGAPFIGDLPVASPPAGLAAFRLPTGVLPRSAGFAYRGGSFADKRAFAVTSVLVKHPRGDLLIDTGFGRSIAAQFANMPALFRALTRYEFSASAADLLERAHYDRAKLRGIILTHAHWDHASGLTDFPGTPVLVTGAERAFVKTGGASTELARSIPNVRYEEYRFESGSYLGFARSHDVYGDGSIVIVPTPGHTPGSVIVFLTLPGDLRFAFVGDLVWQLEGLRLREERPWLMRLMVDLDADGVRTNLQHMARVAARFPELVIVPAHDQRGFARLPLLSPR